MKVLASLGGGKLLVTWPARSSAMMLKQLVDEANAMRKVQLTMILEKEGDGYVSLCPELDIASQGETLDDARSNLREAVEGFLEIASQQEVNERFGAERRVESLEVTVA